MKPNRLTVRFLIHNAKEKNIKINISLSHPQSLSVLSLIKQEMDMVECLLCRL